MESRDHFWYILDVHDEAVTYLPHINVMPAGRVSAAGFIKAKQVVTERAEGSFPFYALLAVHAGSGFVQTSPDGQPFPVTAGGFVLLLPDKWHRYGPARPGEWNESFLTFAGTLFDALLDADVIASESPVISGLPGAYLDRMESLVRLAGSTMGTPASVYLSMIVALICELGSKDASPPVSSRDREWIASVYEHFDCDRPASRTLEWIAAAMGTSYGSFVKRFTRLTGVPPGKAWRQLVMQRAAALLRDDSMSATQIADELGYADPAHFGRRFREHTGFSPGRFRRLSLGR